MAAGGPAEELPKRDGRGPNYTKLPKLEIKYFTGDPLEFPTFQQQFRASIGESDLADVAKFSYLKNLLRGEASRAISGLSVVGENYNSAWNILEQRFGRKNLIVSSLMKQFTVLDPIRDIRDTKGLRALADKIGSGIRALEAQNIRINTFGALLAPLVRQKIPEKLNLRLSRNMAEAGHDDFVDIGAIQCFLETELAARESVELTTMGASNS